MENNKEQLSQLELNIKALEKDGIKVKHMSGYHSKDGVIQLKDIDYKNGIVSFYHSSFDDEKDSDGDIIQKGSFAKTIRENFQRMKHLYNHDRTLAHKSSPNSTLAIHQYFGSIYPSKTRLVSLIKIGKSASTILLIFSSFNPKSSALNFSLKLPSTF